MASLENGPVPATATVTSYFGSQELGLRSDPHRGMDFSVPVGTPVYAAADGVVDSVIPNDGDGGNVVILLHPDLTNITGYVVKTAYLHLSAFKVKEGDGVTAGDVIALSGNTGHSTGPHLHFEVRLVGTLDHGGGELRDDPYDWIPGVSDYPVVPGLSRPSIQARMEASAGPNKWLMAAKFVFVLGVAYVIFG